MLLEQRMILEKYKDSDLTSSEIGAMAGIFYKTASAEYKKFGGRAVYNAQIAHDIVLENMKRRTPGSSAKRLTLDDLKLIEKYKDSELSGAEIGLKIGRHKNVINRAYRIFKTRKEFNADLAYKLTLSKKEEHNEKKRKWIKNQTEGSDYISQVDTDVLGSYVHILEEKKLHNPPTHSGSNLPRFPLKIWVDRYKEEKAPFRANWKKEKRYFEHWLTLFGEKIAIDITAAEIEHAADLLLHKKKEKTGKTLSMETRRKYLLYFSSMYSTAIFEWKWAEFNPLSCVNMKPVSAKYVTMNSSPSDIFVEFNKLFIGKVKERMKELRLTNEDAGKLCGLSKFIFKSVIEPNRNFTIKLALLVCKGLQFKVELG